MQATKITTPAGFVIICDRTNEASFSCAIKHASSTEAQPLIVVNHDATGKAIGGSTATAYIFEAMKARSVKAGYAIEQIEL